MNPVVVGIVNAALPGLGYIIVGKRRVFGWLLLGNVVITYAWMFVYQGTVTPGMWGPLEINSWLGLLAVALLFAAFGYDGYQLAKER